MHSSIGGYLMEMFQILLKHFGPQNWWPAETPLEVIVGAVLTQNTNWKNVESALDNLKKNGLLSLESLHGLPVEKLAEHIRPAGYYNIKARRLKNLVDHIVKEYQGIGGFLAAETGILRDRLLSINGIGPETADSILLYAAKRPVFVVDAYTFRILNRHGLIDDQAAYRDLQDLFMDHIAEDVYLYNELHALIVNAGKYYCRKTPLCDRCPLKGWGPVVPRSETET